MVREGIGWQWKNICAAYGLAGDDMAGRNEKSTGGLLRGRNGFTIVQTCVVLAIMGVLASVGMLELGIDSIGGATRQMFSDLQLARIKAIQSRNVAEIVFTGDGHSYEIRVDEDNDGTQEVIARDLHQDYPLVDLANAPNMRFNSLGMETQCSYTQACTVRLVKGSERQPEFRSLSVLRTGGIWVNSHAG